MVLVRTLNVRRDTHIHQLHIRIYAPREEDGVWMCRYEVDWPEGMKTMDAAGSDAIQALHIAMCMIGAELYTSSYHEEGDLLPWGDWKGYGFPIGGADRDLLVGDDAKYL